MNKKYVHYIHPFLMPTHPSLVPTP
jgi:hypothetical protein